MNPDFPAKQKILVRGGSIAAGCGVKRNYVDILLWPSVPTILTKQMKGALSEVKHPVILTGLHHFNRK
jgi:hypothetical protein